MKNNARFWNSILLASGLVVVGLIFTGRGPVLAQDDDWSAPRIISGPPGMSWFPDMSVDELGSPHVIWCQTIPDGKGELQEQVYYTRQKDGGWLKYNDIVAPSPDIVRNAIATDLRGNVHLLFGGSVYGTLSLYHQYAPLDDAWSASAWSKPHLINQGGSYMADMAADSQGTIHVIYDDTFGTLAEQERVRSDIFYRRSSNGGQNWSRPKDLSRSPQTGSSRPYLEIDRNDVLHVTWDEGWDRLSGAGDPASAFYTSSSDGGESWTPSTVITYPETTVAQLTVGSNDRGGVMLVWRATTRPEIFYQWSADGGLSWQQPATITNIFAREWSGPFDMYDMATDSAGNIHLLASARRVPEREEPLGVYHLTWDGSQWSAPRLVFKALGWHPEYPKIVVHEGNQLHAVWFARQGSVFDSFANRQVWYSHSQTSTPSQAVVPLPTFTPTPPPATPSPVPNATLQQTIDSRPGTSSPGGLKTDHDDVSQLITSLSPLILVFLVIIVLRALKVGSIRR